jgi:hypothetical protein
LEPSRDLPLNGFPSESLGIGIKIRKKANCGKEKEPHSLKNSWLVLTLATHKGLPEIPSFKPGL